MEDDIQNFFPSVMIMGHPVLDEHGNQIQRFKRSFYMHLLLGFKI